MSNPNEGRIGKYVTRKLYTDATIVGKIVDTFGKTGIVVKPMGVKPDPTWKAEWIPGGFAGHCLNNRDQRWLFNENDDEPLQKHRISASFFKWFMITDEPYHFHDYNF